MARCGPPAGLRQDKSNPFLWPGIASAAQALAV